jgi:hypothetical protein
VKSCHERVQLFISRGASSCKGCDVSSKGAKKAQKVTPRCPKTSHQGTLSSKGATSHHQRVLSSMEKCDIISPSATSSSKGPTSSIEGAMYCMQCPIINELKVTPMCARVSCEWSHDRKPKRPPRSAKRPSSSGGDSLHKIGVVAPQHPLKDPSVNQACAYVQPSSEEGLMWSKMHHEDRRQGTQFKHNI